MKITRTNDDRFEIVTDKKKARIERGPRKITAKATKELLSDDVTASHYFAGERDTPAGAVGIGNKKPEKIVGLDANGKQIKIGEDMTYIDWKNRNTNSVWHIYLHDGERYQSSGQAETQDVALTAAINLVI